ncbi:hypothetical protein [Pontibacillus sp. HMF3514]|uniref:hypothetical protein n=1 Tax=Pontibacillus sp. HMF3514 TaxID=2692425 RepID=UPI00131F4A2D|nr:hypothetical protein [Pontibacillus sp. HMF3514]QHE53676.1 hypothetical protein GS400_17365 [Pontibacillus sp. HMF3514]
MIKKKIEKELLVVGELNKKFFYLNALLPHIFELLFLMQLWEQHKKVKERIRLGFMVYLLWIVSLMLHYYVFSYVFNFYLLIHISDVLISFITSYLLLKYLTYRNLMGILSR